jgi:hypothetical protein
MARTDSVGRVCESLPLDDQLFADLYPPAGRPVGVGVYATFTKKLSLTYYTQNLSRWFNTPP